MGPAIIFDKSVIQSLSPEESVWLDQFYLSVITPTYFVEVLADLSKSTSRGTAEGLVSSLAYKTPDYGSKINASYKNLLEGELFSNGKILMDGRPILSGGRSVKLQGGVGVFFEESEEEQSFKRWQAQEYRQLEREFASKWRAGLSNVNLEESYNFFQSYFPLGKPKSLAAVKEFVDFYLDKSDQETVLQFGLSFLGFNPDHFNDATLRWKNSGKNVLREYAPYFHHVLSVDLFFNLAIASDLIGRGRPSHKVDISYLYYLPCCKIFTSNDKLHINIAPLFLREDQVFIVGTELKTDLARLNAHYSTLDDEIKMRGISSFAFCPPNKADFLTSQLWDKFMSTKWRQTADEVKTFPKINVPKGITEKIKEVENGVPLTDEEIGTIDISDPKQMVLKRKVMAKKGGWNRFPPEIVNRQRNSDGEWEDLK